jgi:threonine dehydrogenase-like Zn-dependent dehydrogenase
VSAAGSAAVVLERFGAPVALHRFPVPPAAPGDAVVAVSYGGVCGTDVHLQRGDLAIPVPLVLGHEGLGVVHELGDGVRRDAAGAELRPGDVVMWASSIACGRCVACLVHKEPTLCEHRRTCGVNRPLSEVPALSGSWAEHIYLRAGSTIVRLDGGIDPVAAMSLACAGPTLAHALERRPVRLGEVVVVQGSGPVGLAAAAMAHLSGAREVIVAGGPQARLDLAARAGFGDRHFNVVEAPDQEAVLERVREATPGGRGADLVIECTGVPAAVAQGLRLARRGGAYLVVGQYTDSGDAVLNPHQVVYRQLDVIGSWAFTGAHLVRYVELLPALAARFDLGSLVRTFPLAEAQSAMDQVAAGAVVKAVLENPARP